MGSRGLSWLCTLRGLSRPGSDPRALFFPPAPVFKGLSGNWPEALPGLSPPCCSPRYQGHVPGAAFSFGSTYGATTLKYFQDQRNAALEQSHRPFSKGGHFPTIFSPDPNLVLRNRSQTWDRWLHAPRYTRFNLDGGRSAELSRFYQVGPLTPPLPPPRPPSPEGLPYPPPAPSSQEGPPYPPLPLPHPGPLCPRHRETLPPEPLSQPETW